MTNVQTILTEREKTHGRWEENARISQGLLRVLRTGCRWPDLTDSQLEALQMISHKEHRIVNGDPNVADHWDDIAGYATLEANRLRRAMIVPEKVAPNGDWLLTRIIELGGVPLDADMDNFRFTGAQLRALVHEVRELAIEEGALTTKKQYVRVTECQCENPVIKCDDQGCRCTTCGLPQRFSTLLNVEAMREAIVWEGLDLYIGPVQDVTNYEPPWPNIPRTVANSILVYYLPDRSRIDPVVVEEQLCRIAGKLPRLDYENLHLVYRSLYTKETDGDEYVLLPEFAGWAS